MTIKTRSFEIAFLGGRRFTSELAGGNSSIVRTKDSSETKARHQDSGPGTGDGLRVACVCRPQVLD